MGRHARGASRSRLSVAALVFVAATGAVIAVGSLYSSAAQPVPLAGSVAGSAVVVSSLSCTDGTGGSIVDVLPDGPPGGLPVRANLDACGYQEGQQLQVRYVPGDASQVVLAGNESDDDLVPGDRLLPIGLAFVGLLALAVVLVVWRRSMRDGRSALPAVARRLRPGRHARPDEVQGGGDEASDPEIGALSMIFRSTFDDDLILGSLDLPPTEDREPRPEFVELSFPYSADLAACLHDELFTHRSPTS